MCGIVGYVGFKDAAPLLREGLKRLEYRGYDSAGLAVVSGGALELLRAPGKLANLDALLSSRPLPGSVGLGHTRWATHGKPCIENAHPHADCTKRIAVVHNGIIENHGALRQALTEAGHTFASETDTEVLSHLIEQKLKEMDGSGQSREAFIEAVRRSLLEVRGAYALAILWSGAPDMIVAAKTASPLVVGLGDGETFVASDVPAFLERTREVLFLEDGEMAVLGTRERSFFDLKGARFVRPPIVVPWDHKAAQKGGYPHFMLKEIHEQPEALEATLRGRTDPLDEGALEREAGIPGHVLRGVSQVHLVACGTAFHAGIIGKYLIERVARVPAQVETASEFRYRDPVLSHSTLVIAISQSGETADTLAAAKLAKEQGARVLAVSNTVGSALARAADFNLYTRCGPECGVASTKAFVGQLAALTVFTMHLARALGRLGADEAAVWQRDLAALPDAVRKALGHEPQIVAAAKRLVEARHCLFLGRGLDYATALEGALKLKEISYIHAEGYAAGEMKHGPIALIEPELPVVAIATGDALFEKTLSNLEEARSRGARLVVVAAEGDRRLDGKADQLLEVPAVRDLFQPIVNVIPLQLLAYHVAALRGCDVDQPRNLAKSVTVE